MTTFRFSRWDGSQQVFEIDEDDVLEMLSEDILAHGDVNRAIRDLFRRGIRDENNDRRTVGLRDLMERLRRQRQQQQEQRCPG